MRTPLHTHIRTARKTQTKHHPNFSECIQYSYTSQYSSICKRAFDRYYLSLSSSTFTTYLTLKLEWSTNNEWRGGVKEKKKTTAGGKWNESDGDGQFSIDIDRHEENETQRDGEGEKTIN